MDTTAACAAGAAPSAPATPRHGFTLVELCVTLTAALLLLTLAIPSGLDQLARSRRSDAVAALLRVQWAQERHRQSTGHYAQQLNQLPGASADRSPAGFYRLELRAAGPQAYEAVAVALPSQARDRACGSLLLRVNGFISERQPSTGCWAT